MFSSLRNFHPLRVAASAGLKGALPKVLVGAALLGGGGSVLFAGSAQAITFAQWAGVGVPATPITIDDKTFTYVSSTGLPPTGAAVDVNGTQPVPGDYLFNLDFFPVSSVSTFTLNYIAQVTDPNKFFTAVDLDSDVDAFDPPAEQLDTTWRTDSFTGPVAAALQSLNGSASQAPIAGQPKVLYVTNVYASNGGAIDSFVNSYRQSTVPPTVPGPLPLLGAGMAFGFSRKLRSRIKARVQA